MPTMATRPKIPIFDGQKAAASIMNCCAHFEYLAKHGYMEDYHKTFLEHCLLKVDETMKLSSAYVLKLGELASSEPGFYGPYASPVHFTSACPQGMSTHSHFAGASVRFEEPITSVTPGNVSIKVEETTTSFSASATSTGVGSTITPIAEVTQNGTETTVAANLAHAAGIEAAAPNTSHDVTNSIESSLTTIAHADIQGIETPITPTVIYAETTTVEAPTTTFIDAEPKGIEASITAYAAPNSLESSITIIAQADIKGEVPVTPNVAHAEASNIDAPVNLVNSISNINDNSTSDGDDDDFDFFSMPYDREANRSIYDDPPRSVPSKKTTQAAAKSVIGDSPKKFSSFLQRCDELGIKLASSPVKDIVTAEHPAAKLPESAVAETFTTVEAPNSNVPDDITAADIPKPDVTEVTIAKQSELETNESGNSKIAKEVAIPEQPEVNTPKPNIAEQVFVDEQPVVEVPKPNVTEQVFLDEQPELETQDSNITKETASAEQRKVDTPMSKVTEAVVIAEQPKAETAESHITKETVIEQAKVDIPNPVVNTSIAPKTISKPAQRGYGGVAVKYITEEGTFARDGSVEFQTVGLARGVKPERMVTRHNSGVVVEALHPARGGLTGGGPRGDMSSLKFNIGDRLKIKKMLGNGWYLARKLGGDDEYSTVRIFKMEVGVKIASKTKLIGDTSASASRIAVRAPSPDQDLTWVPPHLRGADPNTPDAETEVEPIVRKRYHEVLYFDGRPPRLVRETVTAVIN